MNPLLDLLLGRDNLNMSTLLDESARLLTMHRELTVELAAVDHFLIAYAFAQGTICSSSAAVYFKLELDLNTEKHQELVASINKVRARLEQIMVEIKNSHTIMSNPRTDTAEVN